nr:UDP-glycosyltransferase [Paris polyphylla]
MVKPGVVFIPCPAMGHFISAVEFAKKLESRFAVTILQIAHIPPAWSSAIKAYVESVVSSGFDIRFEELPHIVPPHAEKQRPETFASRLMEVNKSPARDAISLIPNNNIAAIILDLFGSSMVDVADELGIPAYIYFTSNAALLGSMLYLPTLHVKVPCELMEFGGHISMPGLPPVPPHCMPSFAMDKKDEAYTTFINHGLCFRKAKGLIINTFEDIEPKTLQALADGEYLPDHTMPPVFPSDRCWRSSRRMISRMIASHGSTSNLWLRWCSCALEAWDASKHPR